MDAEILVAEDESAIREGLCALLESEGYTVRAAVDGEDALRLFRECRPDLVLLDVMMPKKNGYAVCSEIRSSDQDVPILFLTAKDGDSDELRGLTLGADDYISKTSSQPVLLARIAAVLNRTGLPSFTYHTVTDRAALLEQILLRAPEREDGPIEMNMTSEVELTAHMFGFSGTTSVPLSGYYAIDGDQDIQRTRAGRNKGAVSGF